MKKWISNNYQWFIGSVLTIVAIFVTIWLNVRPLENEEYASMVTYGEIQAALQEAPLFQRDQIGANYVGMEVSWLCELVSVSKRDERTVLLILCSEPEGNLYHVMCTVLLVDYPELKVADRGTLIQVIGEIESVGIMNVDLRNTKLEFR